MESLIQEYIGIVSNSIIILPSGNRLREGASVRVLPLEPASATETALTPRQPGSAIGKLIIHAEDEEHLNDFQEYMQRECCLMRTPFSGLC